jgi:hypothetical protein
VCGKTGQSEVDMKSEFLKLIMQSFDDLEIYSPCAQSIILKVLDITTKTTTKYCYSAVLLYKIACPFT